MGRISTTLQFPTPTLLTDRKLLQANHLALMSLVTVHINVLFWFLWLDLADMNWIWCTTVDVEDIIDSGAIEADHLSVELSD